MNKWVIASSKDIAWVNLWPNGEQRMGLCFLVYANDDLQYRFHKGGYYSDSDPAPQNWFVI